MFLHYDRITKSALDDTQFTNTPARYRAKKPRLDLTSQHSDGPKREPTTVDTTSTSFDSIERNDHLFGHKHSRLLQLSAEIRDRIWIETLGGRHIHIWRYRRSTGSLTHDICTARNKTRVEGFHNVTSNELSAIYSNETKAPFFDRNHSSCRNRVMIGAKDPQLSLTLLRLSRQIYLEADKVLWTTNTFCFDDPLFFQWFLKNLGPRRKHLLRYLYLAVPFPVSMRQWSMNLISDDFSPHLHGLREVHLLIRQIPIRRISEEDPDLEALQNAYSTMTMLDFHHLLTLGRLPLEKLTISVNGATRNKLSPGFPNQMHIFTRELRATLSPPPESTTKIEITYEDGVSESSTTAQVYRYTHNPNPDYEAEISIE